MYGTDTLLSIHQYLSFTIYNFMYFVVRKWHSKSCWHKWKVPLNLRAVTIGLLTNILVWIWNSLPFYRLILILLLTQFQLLKCALSILKYTHYLYIVTIINDVPDGNQYIKTSLKNLFNQYTGFHLECHK